MQIIIFLNNNIKKFKNKKILLKIKSYFLKHINRKY